MSKNRQLKIYDYTQTRLYKFNWFNRRIIIKSEEQIEGIRKSCQLTKNLLDMVEERISEGITTNDINEWVHIETLSKGAIPAPLNYGRGQGRLRMPFPKSVCTSAGLYRFLSILTNFL